LGDALNTGYLYLELKCLGCDTHQTVSGRPRFPRAMRRQRGGRGSDEPMKCLLVFLTVSIELPAYAGTVSGIPIIADADTVEFLAEKKYVS
jgi:hypothetical protein